MRHEPALKEQKRIFIISDERPLVPGRLDTVKTFCRAGGRLGSRMATADRQPHAEASLIVAISFAA
jgi:hypothetical protein